MAQFIKLPGNTSGEMFRINVDKITKYKKHENGGTAFFTYMDRNNPYFVTSTKIEEVDKLIQESQPSKYSLKP